MTTRRPVGVARRAGGRTAPDPTKFDVEALLQAGEFPFRCEFSLRELARYWEREAEAGHPIGRLIRERLAGAPELVGSIADRAALDRHRDLVDLMMSAVFPPALREETLGAALVPFQLHSLYATPTMERRGLDESGRLRMPSAARLSTNAASAAASPETTVSSGPLMAAMARRSTTAAGRTRRSTMRRCMTGPPSSSTPSRPGPTADPRPARTPSG